MQTAHSATPASTTPIYMPSKLPSYTAHAQPLPYCRPAISPPSVASSVNTSAVPSLISGEDSPSNATSVDLMDMMTERLSNAVNPVPLDRSLARQAQKYVYKSLTYADLAKYNLIYSLLIYFSSGELNAKQRELLELQAMAQRRIRGARVNLANGMKAAKEVRQDLEWTQTRVRYVKVQASPFFLAQTFSTLYTEVLMSM